MTHALHGAHGGGKPKCTNTRTTPEQHDRNIRYLIEACSYEIQVVQPHSLIGTVRERSTRERSTHVNEVHAKEVHTRTKYTRERSSETYEYHGTMVALKFEKRSIYIKITVVRFIC